MAEPWERAFTTIGAHPKRTMGVGVVLFIVVLLVCCLCSCSSLMYSIIEKKKVCGNKLLGGQYGCRPDTTSGKCVSPADTVPSTDTSGFANVTQYEPFEAENYEDDYYD